jgi:hypothetical protein
MSDSLTKAEAWWRTAMAFYKPPSRRTEFEKKMTRYGICNACLLLRKIGLYPPHSLPTPVDYDIKKMVVLIMYDVDKYHCRIGIRKFDYFCEFNTREFDYLRADYCMYNYWMEVIK